MLINASFHNYYHTHETNQTSTRYRQWMGLTVIHTLRSYVHSPRADLSDLGLLGEQSFPEWEIPCLGRRWTSVQNLTLLALSSPEKSVTLQTQKNKQRKKQKNKQTKTVNDISACVDNSNLSVLVILRRKCTLAASRAYTGESRWGCAARPIKVRKRLDRQTDRQADGR